MRRENAPYLHLRKPVKSYMKEWINWAGKFVVEHRFFEPKPSSIILDLRSGKAKGNTG
jgi:hypothetical protein